MFRVLIMLFLISAMPCALPADARADLARSLDVLRSADSGEADAAQLSGAWRELVDRPDAERLFTLLAAMDGSGPLAANWITSAVDATVEKLRSKDAMPEPASLERFVTDRSGSPRARRLAYELLVEADADTPGRLLPDMLDDSSLAMRRDAVEQLAGRARAVKDSSPDVARTVLEKAIDAARDFDQVKRLAGELKTLEVEVDLARHFGIIRRWQLIAPFDDTDRRGFETAYPPELENAAGRIDYSKSHQGKTEPIRWFTHTTDPKRGLGRVDFNQIQGKSNSVTGYAATEFIAPGAGEAQLRIQSFNALKVWLNGRPVAVYLVYHGGSQFDQYVIPVKLRKGKNVILVKVCQNNQPQSWAQNWNFSLRVCDFTGGAILSTDRPE